MVAPRNDDGTSLQFHSSLVDAVRRFAEFKAELTASCIGEIRAEFKQQGRTFSSNGFPAGFLLELGAFAQIRHWDRQGLRPFLPPVVPTCEQVARDLVQRVLQDPLQFETETSAWISRFVFSVWLREFAWDGPEILHADLVVGAVDEDKLVEVLAELVWSMRHRLGETQNKQSTQ